MKKSEESVWNLWNTIKRNNEHIMRFTRIMINKKEQKVYLNNNG